MPDLNIYYYSSIALQFAVMMIYDMEINFAVRQCCLGWGVLFYP